MEDLEDIENRHLTIPEEMERTKDKDPLKQVPIRLHQNDHRMIMIMLKKDQMSLQKFVSLCVRAYLDADPMFMKSIKSYRELEVVPKNIRDKHVLSHRERTKIFDELEKAQKEEE